MPLDVSKSKENNSDDCPNIAINNTDADNTEVMTKMIEYLYEYKSYDQETLNKMVNLDSIPTDIIPHETSSIYCRVNLNPPPTLVEKMVKFLH